ncbi:MAG TPA: TlpA disulfide reductase family protein [Anaeromyxobacter sp.]|nr:TlpA disulfide reductase family protein [Anaeromyxobacter sp.]
MRRWLQLAFLAVAAVIVAEMLLHDHSAPPPPAAPPTPNVDALTAPPAPELSLKRLDGTPVDLHSLRGKVVAVNFWATWCAPCRTEMPELVEVWRTRKDRCFELLGVAAMSGRADTEQMAKSIPYPVLYDEGNEASDAWAVTSLPRTFVLDTEGRVRQVFRGMIDGQKLAGVVDPLLPKSCPSGSG